MLLGDPVQAIPDPLGQTGGGEKEQFHAREETLAQLAVLLQGADQFFPALGHGQVGGGRNFLEVAQCLGKPLGGGLAVVQVKGATVVQHDADVVAATKGVVPRQPVHQHRRLFAEHRKGLQQHLLVGAEHALGGDHRLGQLGGAGGKQELGDAVRTGGGKRRFGFAATGLLQQTGKGCLPPPRHFAANGNQRRLTGQYRVDRPLVGGGIADEHQPGLQQIADMPQLGEVLGQQRIGRRNRAIGNTGIHGAQRNLQVFDVIARQQRQGALG
ncbi:hypothetical protein D3C78_972260 [compost metagenome]